MNKIMLPSIMIPTSPPSCFSSCQCKSVLLGLGSGVGIIIEGSIILMKLLKVQTSPTWPFYSSSLATEHDH